jgi:hypothetical protein
MKWDGSLWISLPSCCFDHSFSPAQHSPVYLESNNLKSELQLSEDLNILNCWCSPLISQHVFLISECWRKMKQLHIAVIVSHIRLHWCIFKALLWHHLRAPKWFIVFEGTGAYSKHCFGASCVHFLVSCIKIYFKLPPNIANQVHLLSQLQAHQGNNLNMFNQIMECVKKHATHHRVNFATLEIMSRQQFLKELSKYYN